MTSGTPPDTAPMAALMPCSFRFAQQLCERASAELDNDVCVVANINTASQMVVSGTPRAVFRAVELGKLGAGGEQVKRAFMLDVAGAFHSPLMQPARDAMRSHIAALRIRRPCVPLISNVTAQPVSDPEQICALMLQHFTAPVLWYRSVLHCLSRGMDEFAELGPSSVVTRLITDVHQHCHTAQPPLPAPGAVTTHALCTAEEGQRFIALQRARQREAS